MLYGDPCYLFQGPVLAHVRAFQALDLLVKMLEKDLVEAIHDRTKLICRVL